MCDSCDKAQDELAKKEIEFLGGNNGQRRVAHVNIGVNDKSEIVIAQTLEIAFMNEEGVTKHEKTSFVYLDTEMLRAMIEAL